MFKIQIKSILGKVLFEYQKENEQPSIKEALINANLKGAYLTGAYLKAADLKGANLKGAYLEGANLKGAYLKGAYLKGAYLEGADLEGAYLKGAYLKGAYLEGADLEGAYLKGANLKGANLRGANLKGAYLKGANLKGANLRGANLKGADLEGANLRVPIIESIHQKVYEAASVKGALNMSNWHTCGSTHCRAGWVTHLAGEAGRKLEQQTSTATAAYLIYRKSDPYRSFALNFYASNEEALSDMKRLAELEAEQSRN